MPSKNDTRSRKHASFGPALGLAGLLLIAACAGPFEETGKATIEKPGTIIKVPVGETRVFIFPGMTKIAVGDPTVADVRSTGNDELEIIGQSEGATTLLVWTKEGKRTSHLIRITK
jgi:Flp pilus assembly secretin CpaC